VNPWNLTTAVHIALDAMTRHVPAAAAVRPPPAVVHQPYAARLSGIQMPSRIAKLPRHMGAPLPWFCLQHPTPDFRVVRPGVFQAAIKRRLCWICGEPNYPKRQCFVAGPMCVITGTVPEPPSHPECARFAAQACPFLANPKMRRNEQGLPDDLQQPAGEMIRRNPGVAAIVITNGYTLFGDGRGGTLVSMGPPLAVEWWAHGRPATRAEVEHSIATGLPLLEEQARLDGEEGMAALRAQHAAMLRWLPPLEALPHA
jgi:hypothetical protein